MCINNLGVVTVVKEGRSRIPSSQQTSATHGQPNPASQRTAIFWLSAMCTKNAFDYDWPVAGHADVLSGSSCFHIHFSDHVSVFITHAPARDFNQY